MLRAIAMASLSLLLSACATENVLRIPDSAPMSMHINWVRVESLEDLSFHCRRGLHRSERAAACARSLPLSRECTVYTWQHVTLETVGHEVAHCYLGAWHH